MAVLTDRLTKTLAAYCTELDDQSLDDLAAVVQSGGASWFPDEFGAAVREKAITPQIWERITDIAMDDDDDALLDQYLRQIWARTAPTRPYPLDEQPSLD